MLSNDQKAKLRDEVKGMLNKVPEGKKVNLGKELVESLLFDEKQIKVFYEEGSYEYSNESNCKFLVWSGSFLQKLDLSEVSFDDVMWDTEYIDTELFSQQQEVKDYYEGVEEIDLSNTNAKIDFSKSYSSKQCLNGHIYESKIRNCNFANVDLSNNTLFGDDELEYWCENVDFSNTGLKINLDKVSDYMEENNTYALIKCNFTGLDFSDYTANETFVNWCFFELESSNLTNNYTNTGLKIDSTKLDDIAYKENIFDELKKGNLDGCYIDGKKVESSKDYSKFIDLLDPYNQSYESLLNSIENSIDDQVGGFKK